MGMQRLALAGRILIFKSLALSKLLYVSTMKCLPKQMLDRLNTLQKSFIWSNRKPKIKHSTLIADYGEGGYKDIKSKISALRVTWVTRLLYTPISIHRKSIQLCSFQTLGAWRLCFILT